jgi:phosphoribosylanthranilate isomerase
MPLKTIVKVGNISNLSDARYCSGMGVDMLGIAVSPAHGAYLSPELYHEIRGWIAGPSIVAELYGMREPQSIKQIIEAYVPDYLELDISQLNILSKDITLPLIVKISQANDLNKLTIDKSQIAYVVLEEANVAESKSIGSNFKVLIELSAVSTLQTIIDNYPIEGFALIGSPEIRPGFKDYGDLADVLEHLETD